VPIAEKDEAKANGARWDAVLQTWWISRRSLADHPAVWRWIPDSVLSKKVKQAADFNNGEPWQQQALAVGQEPQLPQLPQLPTCDCASPPWEHCRHTLRAGANSLAH
jgi:hypothetical protein